MAEDNNDITQNQGEPGSPEAAAPPAATPTVIKAKPAKAKRMIGKDGLEEAVVKRGTLVVGDNEHAGPGDTVRLDPEEVAALRKSGVLVDPEADAAAAEIAATMVSA